MVSTRIFSQYFSSQKAAHDITIELIEHAFFLVLGCPRNVLGCPSNVLGCPRNVLGCPGAAMF